MAKPLSCLLVTMHSPEGESQKVVNESSFTIGRAHECAISFSDLNVSRNHLSVKNKAGKVWIEDLGSSNGTFVNGDKIPAKRSTQVEPGDLVQLGTAGPKFTVQAIEKVFDDAEVEESSLNEEDRESVKNLIHGAHAEAGRIVNIAKDSHEKMIHAAQERADQIEKDVQAKCKQFMEKARDEAAKLANEAKIHYEKKMKEAQADHDMLIKKAKAEHDDTIAEGKAYHDKTVADAVKDAMEKAKSTVDEALQDAKDEAEQLLKEAQATARRTLDEAKLAGEELMEKAKVDAEEYAREHREGSEKEADAYFSKRHHDIEQYAIKMTAEVDQYRAEQERSSREMMAKEIEDYIKQKRELEGAVHKSKTELDEITPKLKNLRAEFESVQTQAQGLRAEVEKLKIDKADMLALENKREDLAMQVGKLQKQLEGADKDLQARLAETQTTIEKESSRRRTALEEELTALRLAEMERLRRERAEAVESIARERERLAKKIHVEVQQAAVSSIPVENWRAVASSVETVIQENLKLHALSGGAEESISPLISEIAVNRKRSRVMFTLQGFFAGMLILSAGYRITQEIFKDQDPVKAQAEESARLMKEDLERRKFNPPQDDEVRPTYADSVIYTRGFAENYRSPEFQKEWMQVASKYFLKKWKVQEETVIQVNSATNTLVGALAERKEAIHPDYVKDGLKKMNDLEAETLDKVKELLGSEVRLEAYKRLEKKTYIDFFSGRQPAQTEPASE